MHVVFIIKVLTNAVHFHITSLPQLGEGRGKRGCVQSISSSTSPSAFIQTPVNTTVCLGSTAQFVCSATNVSNILYLVDYMVISSVVSHHISVSAPTYIGNMTLRNLTVTAVVNNNSLITCVAVVSNGTAMNSSAYLSIQGQSTCIWYVLMQYVD